MMKLRVLSYDEVLQSVPKIDEKFRPVWEGLSPQHQIALALYFLPHRSGRDVLTPTRPRVIKWYCPFAGQKNFPSGHRYCVNVYTGCVHECVYCYAMSYSPDHASCKHNFAHMVEQDVEDLERFDVPPAPVHLSNSTDPFQPLETIHHHTQFALQQILGHRRRLTSVIILTKNPLLAVRLGYSELLQRLVELPSDHPQYERFRQMSQPGFCMEVSLAFWREEAAKTYDVGAPSVAERIEGLRALAAKGIPLVLRIDPLLPRSPLTDESDLTMGDLGLPKGQSLDDWEHLVLLAKELNARHVVYSLAPIMQTFRKVYELMAAPLRLDWRSASWRLPHNVAEARITAPFLEICRRHGVPAKFCMSNLVETP
jgi:hypothetical protein